MSKIQITVLKKQLFKEFSKYTSGRLETCPCFEEGQVFVTTYEKPAGFWDWAWNDLHAYIASFMTGGNFSEGIFEGWMNDKNTMIACCTDGIRPVVFEIKKMDEK